MKTRPERKTNNRLDKVICREIVEVLQDNHGNMTETARDLGVSRATIYNYVKKYKIEIKRKNTISISSTILEEA